MSWHSVPFVRLLLPLVLGIVAYSFLGSSLSPFFLMALLCSGPVFLVVKGQEKAPSIQATRVWGVGALLALIGLGYGLSAVQDTRQQQQYVGKYVDSLVTYVGIIATPLEQKAKTMKAVVQLTAVLDKEDWQPCSGKVLTYIKLDTASIHLDYGRELLFTTTLKTIAPPQNPAAFDAQNYYAQQEIYQQCYLKREQWQAMNWEGKWWKQQLYHWRTYLLAILKKNIVTPNEYAVASALLLGAKSSLDSTLKNAYADTGAMHVLAVSGLHVGILIIILGWLLSFLEKLGNKGKRLRALLLLGFLWLFALLTGASASVLRASTMFSFLLLGQVLGKSMNVYNSLAASAFILLCFDTNLLYQVGFQLSYLALLGIVYFYPKIYQFWTVEFYLGDKIWQGIAMSLAAQLATTPLSLYYFNQFPTFFWLSGLVVSAFAGILLGLGLALLLVAQLPMIGEWVANVLEWALWGMNSLIFGIQQLPGAVWEGFWLSAWQVGLAYFILIAGIICLLQRRLPWGIAALTGLSFFVVFEFWQKSQQLQQAQLCIYSSRQYSAWSILHGQQAFTWANAALLGSQQLDYLQERYLYSKGIQEHSQFPLDSAWQHPIGQYANGKGWFFHTRLALYGPEEVALKSTAPLAVDYVLLYDNPKLYDLTNIQQLYHYKTLVFDGSTPYWKRQQWRLACDSLGIDYVDVMENGALVMDLR